MKLILYGVGIAPCGGATQIPRHSILSGSARFSPTRSAKLSNSVWLFLNKFICVCAIIVCLKNQQVIITLTDFQKYKSKGNSPGFTACSTFKARAAVTWHRSTISSSFCSKSGYWVPYFHYLFKRLIIRRNTLCKRAV